MKFVLLFISYLFAMIAYGQTVTFEEIRLEPNPKFFNVKYVTIVYPIVVTKNSAVDEMINNEIKTQVLDIEDNNASAAKLLAERIDEGLINLSYEVSFKKNNILSMSITSEGCAAYCSSYDNYFNFDLKTGELIGISTIIDETKIDSLRTLVQKEKRKALDEYKREEFLEIGGLHIDSADYRGIVNYVDENCLDVEIGNFSLSDSAIEFMDRCVFPHVIRSQEPVYHLVYSYKFLSEFLKPEFRSRLK